MIESPTRAYGTTRRRRPDLSYGEIERAATALLKTGERPTVEGVRKALGGGSPKSILDALQRFWRDLGQRIDGDAPALSRLPAEIADLAEGLWVRALALAADATQVDDAAAQERLVQLRRENELRSHVISLREKELDTLLRSRERTVKELETHLATAMTFVANAQADIRALETRAAATEAEVEGYRNRLTNLLARAVAKSRSVARPVRAMPVKSKAARRHLKFRRAKGRTRNAKIPRRTR